MIIVSTDYGGDTVISTTTHAITVSAALRVEGRVGALLAIFFPLPGLFFPISASLLDVSNL